MVTITTNYPQIKFFLQKISLSSHDTEKVLAELDKEEIRAKEQAKTTAQNLKTSFSEIEKKLEKLLDVYLEETITVEEYASRKEKLVKQKVGLAEEIRGFEQRKVCCGSNRLVSSFYRLIKPRNCLNPRTSRK